LLSHGGGGGAAMQLVSIQCGQQTRYQSQLFTSVTEKTTKISTSSNKTLRKPSGIGFPQISPQTHNGTLVQIRDVYNTVHPQQQSHITNKYLRMSQLSPVHPEGQVHL
jgi:hypothetical protein